LGQESGAGVTGEETVPPAMLCMLLHWGPGGVPVTNAFLSIKNPI